MIHIRSLSSSLFAALYDAVMEPLERARVRTLRQRLLSVAQGDLLEIGAGTGVNFPFYTPTNWVVAIEPKRGMQVRAQHRAVQCCSHVMVAGGVAEQLPLPDASFDTVVSTFVLCSVSDQAQAVAELWRVLRPGGIGLFLEHVRSPHPFWFALQRVWNPIQMVVGDGCCLTRETEVALLNAGFIFHSVKHLGGGPLPIRIIRAERPAY